MNSSKQVVFAGAFVALALSTQAFAQQAAGRVLIAVGSVTVERGAQRIPAATGTEIRKGDTIQVGAQSNAQVRFIDESLVALRPGTTFRINEFSYRSETKEKDSAVFSLLKGGLRTVTGLVGRTNHEDYQVETPTATIGIRGTHYTLRVCDDDCEETAGTAQAEPIHLAAAAGTANDAGPVAQAPAAPTRASNGTYGSVTEGRINVANQSGSRQFGSDQFFHVASRTAAAQQLIGPPPFLRDRLEGRGRSSSSQSQSSSSSSGGGSQQQQQQQGGTSGGTESAPTVALTGQNGLAGDSRISSVTSTPIVSNAVTPTVTQVTNQATVDPTSIIQPTANSSNQVYRLAGTGLNIPFAACTNTCEPVSAADFIVSVNPATQTARIILAGLTAEGSQFNINNTFGDFPVTVSGNTLVVNATVKSADYPNSQGSFRCSDCGPGNTPSVFVSITYSVTISGGQATVSVTGDDGGGTGTIIATLPLADFSSYTKQVAIAGRNFGAQGGGSVYVQTNSAGQPVYVGEPLGIGNNIVKIGTGTNTTLGSSPTTGNLVWGTWTGQATGVNTNYQPFTQSPGSVSPWIVGDTTNVLPATLGTISFTPFASVVGNGASTAGTLNSASLVADFVSRSLTLNVSATPGAGGGTYVMNGVTNFSAVNGRFGAGFSSVSCSGSCIPGPIGGNFNGFFAGASAAGAGVSFSVNNTSSIGVLGVIGFKR